MTFVPRTDTAVMALLLAVGLALPLPASAQTTPPVENQAATPAVPPPAVTPPPMATAPASPAPASAVAPAAVAAPAAAATAEQPTAQAQGSATPIEQVPASASEPDPLTPPKVAEPLPAAPGVEKAAEAPKSEPKVEAHPVVAEVRKVLANLGAQTGGATREDRAALTAFYADGNGQPVWTSATGVTPKGKAVVAEMKRAADYGLEASAFEVPPAPANGASTEVLADQEIRIGLAALKYARHARGGRVDPQTISKLIDHQPRVYEPRSVINALAVSDEADVYLRGLHPKHAGFKKLQKALVAARAAKTELGQEAAAPEPAKKGRKSAAAAPSAAPAPASSEVVQRIIVNMERWRWMPDNMGAFHVWDNVPEQLTRVMKDGKAILTEKIVVGKPITQTPEFSAPMKFVIFHPSWGVPEGIKTNELAPMLRRASANNSGFFGSNDGASRALKRHELVVMQNGRQVNPDNINWSSVDVRQFQFTQPPSGKNVLGVVKFRFPNRHDVYMHDTAERHLFNTGVRAFSHGCMRVQNPLHLAEVILAYDKGWTPEMVRSAVARGSTTDITLDKSVPVHITYFTAAVDDDGKLRLFGDLYGKDARVASALSGKQINLAASVATADPGEARQGGKRDRQARVKKKDEPWNPFGFLSN